MSIFIVRTGLLSPSINSAGVALRRFQSTWATKVADPSSQIQTYISKSRDPFLNLSIEHYLFQKSPPGSKVLFFYTNRPCIVIGRNQNPWLEVNLALLQPQTVPQILAGEPHALGKVDLVRRRSGGGTVFHDEGNVNWSVISDFTDFTRDKHVEMVVRSLRSLGIDRARVNERHDIVLDQGLERQCVDESDTHITSYTSKDAESLPLKVSGSAYKLSRNRALHHGTALLQSPNLQIISQYLHSPAKKFITAKGVESVSSPIGNIGISNASFEIAVQAQFASMYGSSSTTAQDVDEKLLGIPEIAKGYEELKSPEWTFAQTPQFSITNQAGISDNPVDCLGKFTMNVRNGAVEKCESTSSEHETANKRISTRLDERIAKRKLHEIDNWAALVTEESPNAELDELSKFLNQMLPPIPKTEN